MKRDKKKVHRGKPVYTFQGVDYLARRDTSRCLGVCRKHKNGRYYMGSKSNPLSFHNFKHRARLFVLIHDTQTPDSSMRLNIDAFVYHVFSLC